MKMKYLLAASAAALIAATSANAADIVQRAPYEPAPVVTVATFSWTGGYVGGEIGNSWTNSSVENTRSTGLAAVTKTSDVKPNAKGFVGGLYAGYNFEMSDNIIVGAETDFVWGNLKETYADKQLYTATGTDQYTVNGTIKQKWAGATRVRVGYAMDRFLPYLAGGVAYAKVDVAGNSSVASEAGVTTAASVATYNSSKTLVGWTIGAGVDYAVTDNVLVRLEYRYADYGSKTNTYLEGLQEKVEYKSNDVRVGVAYKF